MAFVDADVLLAVSGIADDGVALDLDCVEDCDFVDREEEELAGAVTVSLTVEGGREDADESGLGVNTGIENTEDVVDATEEAAAAGASHAADAHASHDCAVIVQTPEQLDGQVGVVDGH